MRRTIACCLLFLYLQVINSYAYELSPEVDAVLGNLEKNMSQVQTIQTGFVQEKNLSLFKQKIILQGKVFIQKPGMLSWRVFTPMRYSMVINGKTISQWDEDTNQVQQVSLANNPSFQVGITQMQNWFCGAFRSMQNDYQIALIKAHPITLEFIPLENAVPRNFIKRVVVLFEDDERYLKEIDIEEQNGDSTALKFIDAKINQAIEARAWDVKADVR